MYANFRIEGKVNELIDLFTYKRRKKSAFCFKIFVGTSDEWDAELVSELLISFSTSGRHTVLKEKLTLHFSRIILILG